jgi:hypothetical protein
MMHFKLFEFLWKEDLNNLFSEFIRHEPSEHAVKREIERLVRIEKRVFNVREINHTFILILIYLKLYKRISCIEHIIYICLILFI